MESKQLLTTKEIAAYLKIAGVHLFHPPTDSHNLPYIEKHLKGKRFVVINLAFRRQGLLTAPGNPLQITGITDLTRSGRPCEATNFRVMTFARAAPA